MATSHITTDTINFYRIGILVEDVFPAILRDILDCHMPPADFVKTLQANKSQLQRIFNKSQWTLFYGGVRGTRTSKDCDMMLLYILLRNVSGLIPQINGWGRNPSPSDRSMSACVERLRIARNSLYARMSEATINNADFNTYWQELRRDIYDIQTFLGPRASQDFVQWVDRLETDDPEQLKRFPDDRRQLTGKSSLGGAGDASSGSPAKKTCVSAQISGRDVRWEWEGDKNKWTAYSDAINQDVTDHYNSSNRKKPFEFDVSSGVKMIVKHEEMVQKNKTTGWERRLRLCIKDDTDGEFYVWKWEDERGHWNPYNAKISFELEEEYLGGKGVVNCVASSRSYDIDVKKMEQLNTVTKVKRKVARQKFDVGKEMKDDITKKVDVVQPMALAVQRQLIMVEDKTRRVAEKVDDVQTVLARLLARLAPALTTSEDTTGAELFTATSPTFNSIFVLEKVLEASKSVGIIHRNGDPCGTGFRVGSKYIMTAAHVLKLLLGFSKVAQCSKQDMEAKLKEFNKHCLITFNYITKVQTNDHVCASLVSNVPFLDNEIDIAVVEINGDMPSAFTVFGELLWNEECFHIVGHNDGDPKQIESDVRIRKIDSNEVKRLKTLASPTLGKVDYHPIEKSWNYAFDCGVSNGASGSPGIIVYPSGDLKVVTVLLGGCPYQYYEIKKESRPQNVPDKCLVEYGVNFTEVFRRMPSHLSEDIQN